MGCSALGAAIGGTGAAAGVTAEGAAALVGAAPPGSGVGMGGAPVVYGARSTSGAFEMRRIFWRADCTRDRERQ